MEAKIIVFLFLTNYASAYFDVEYQNVEQLSGGHFVDFSNLKVKKIPGTKSRGLFGSVVIHGHIDNTFQIMCKFYSKQGGEYRLTPFKFSPQPVLDTFNNDKYFAPDFVAVSNFTQPLPSPVPKTTFMVNGYKATIPQPLTVAFQTGDYSGEVILLDKDGEVMFSVMGYTTIVQV